MQLHVHRLGDPSRPVLLLVHGSLLDGLRTWVAQRPLADRFRLLIPDRRGYGRSRPSDREDFEIDAGDLVELLAGLPVGAHLAGHSYGGLVALLAAASLPANVRSLTVIEPPAVGIAPDDPAVRSFVARLQALFASGASSPEALLAGFLEIVGIPPPQPGPLSPSLARGVRLLTTSRPPWEASLPIDALRGAAIPFLAVSGGHEPAFEVISDGLAAALDGERAVIEGGGHAVPYAGEAFNARLAAFVEAVEAARAARTTRPVARPSTPTAGRAGAP